MKFTYAVPGLILLVPTFILAHDSTPNSALSTTPITVTSTPSTLTFSINQTLLSDSLPLAILVDNTPLVFHPLPPSPTLKCQSTIDWLREIQFFTRFLLTILLAHIVCHVLFDILDFIDENLLREDISLYERESRRLEEKIAKLEKESRVWRRERHLLRRDALRKKRESIVPADGGGDDYGCLEQHP